MKSTLAGLAFCALLLLAAVPAEAALLHLYTFDANASDSVGSANGVLFGNAAVSGGQLVLDGSGDYVEFGSFLIPTTGSFTLSMFADQTAFQPGQYVELISQGGGPGFYVGRDHPGSSGNMRVSDGWLPNVGAAFPSDLGMHHYAVTRDQTLNTTKLYIDGVLAATRNNAIAMASGPANGFNVTNTRLGRQYGTNLEYFNGAIDTVAIYSEALGDEEIELLSEGQIVGQVPEPSTVALLVTGLAGLVVARRRRR